ncbi:hypothetical protein SSMG_08275 [Streptomyces sp. AA4]|nr:hypothetical protein SSMG_08275 [Streptomyces sp. AA4]
MTAIDRTAYPRFKRVVPARELAEAFTPTVPEVAWAREKTQNDQHLLAMVVWLKSYQRLGYFPKLAEVPAVVVEHVRGLLELPGEVRAVKSKMVALDPAFDPLNYEGCRSFRDFLARLGHRVRTVGRSGGCPYVVVKPLQGRPSSPRQGRTGRCTKSCSAARRKFAAARHPPTSGGSADPVRAAARLPQARPALTCSAFAVRGEPASSSTAPLQGGGVSAGTSAGSG